MLSNMNGGFFKNGFSFLKSIDYAGLLDGASKTLNVINQAIPVYNQVKPLVSNFQLLKNIHSVMMEEDTSTSTVSSIFYI